jgi:alkanesulfonate monooxygenase SsuD/methylene tetrahydromethanopterin reductase-like flavin-dependent oxidoreductase (luciferase family)
MTDPTRLSFGIKTTPQNVSFADILKVWEEADTIPVIEHAWLWDHLQPMRGDTSIPVPEGWTALAALAARTNRLQLGLVVTNNLIRPPALLAKIAATTDVIADGRLVLGIGAGGSAGPESEAYGIPQPGAGERIARLAESITLIKRMFTEDSVDFEGKYYKLVAARCEPKPVHQPYPPIMIGGAGERATLRVVAEHANIWNMPGPPYFTATEFRHKCEVLDEHCAAIGRDPNEITRSVQTHANYEDPAASRDTLLELIDAGARHFVLNLPTPYPTAPATWLAEEIIKPVAAKASVR